MKNNILYSPLKREEDQLIRQTLNGVSTVKVFIHRIKFFSYYKIKEIENIFGKLFYSYKFDSKMENYLMHVYKQLKNGKLTIYFYPREGYFPKAYFVSNSASHKLVFELYQLMPELKLSQIEYTIDFYCKENKNIAKLFYFLRKNIYFPYAKETYTNKGGRFAGIELNRSTNALFQVDPNSTSRYIKIYERGKDKDKQGKSWPHKNCDRVRLEFVYKRRKLKARGLNTLSNLFQNPMFSQLIGQHPKLKTINEIRFRKFKSNSKFPQYWEDYLTEDKNGKINCFIEEYTCAGKIVKSPSQYTEENELFNGLIEMIYDAIVRYDKRWINISKLKSKKITKTN